MLKATSRKTVLKIRTAGGRTVDAVYHKCPSCSREWKRASDARKCCEPPPRWW